MVLGWVVGGWADCWADIVYNLHSFSRHFCKNMHFFYIFLQFYLHMSKKSSTFVSDLGIVPTATINNIRDMKKCIFKCQNGKMIVGVYTDQQKWSMHGEPIYRVYHNRKWMWRQNWFKLEDALQACIHLALLHNYYVTLHKK